MAKTGVFEKLKHNPLIKTERICHKMSTEFPQVDLTQIVKKELNITELSQMPQLVEKFENSRNILVKSITNLRSLKALKDFNKNYEKLSKSMIKSSSMETLKRKIPDQFPLQLKNHH